MISFRKKIIFIINSAQNQRCIKRVNEFVNNGYEVAAYAFTRGEELRNRPQFELGIIGHISNDTPYCDRLRLIYKAIKGIIIKHKQENVMFYLFSLDVALMFRLQCSKKYIYEESDLVHTYISNKWVQRVFEYIDKKIIKGSVLTVFTSQGFIKYHFKDDTPNNTIVVPNRLAPEILDYSIIPKDAINTSCIKFGFVGAVRFKSLYRLAETILNNFPNHEFHFYGTINSNRDGDFLELDKFQNCFFHGGFKNPQDLPHIYSSIDIVISTYDLVEENVKYAEPNKLYEAIYFETPIVVTTGTYLAEKVNELGIGYDVDAMNEKSVISFVNSLTQENLQKRIDGCKRIDKEKTLNLNKELFERLDNINIKQKNIHSIR